MINPDGITHDIKLQFLQASHERKTGSDDPFASTLPMSELFMKYRSLDDLNGLINKLCELRLEMIEVREKGRHHSKLMDLSGQGIIIYLEADFDRRSTALLPESDI